MNTKYRELWTELETEVKKLTSGIITFDDIAEEIAKTLEKINAQMDPKLLENQEIVTLTGTRVKVKDLPDLVRKGNVDALKTLKIMAGVGNAGD